MKICCLVTIALFVECCGYAQSSLGPVDESSIVTVRGRLKRTSLEGEAYPIAQLKVTLKREPADAKTVGIETVTSEDGMFYFYKIPPGSYILDISPSEPPFPKNIEVRGVASYEDIQEITLPVPTNPGPTPTPSPGDWTYYGELNPSNQTWSGKYFRKEGDADGIPQVGDVVVAQGNVNVRKGPAYRTGEFYFNEDITGKIVHAGERLKVLEVRGPFPRNSPDPGYPWLYFRFERLKK